MKTCKAGSIPARFNRGSQTQKIRHCQAGSGHASYKACSRSTGFSGSRLFNAKSESGSAERKEKDMGTFMQAFERAAVKYAEYVKTKLMFSASIQEIKPGQEVFFREPEKEAEQLMCEMQTLNQIAQTLKENPGGGGRKMAENKRMEIMLAQTSREETKEVLDFMQTLNPYEQREFMGFVRGAKLVKAFQEAKQEAAAV